MTVVCGQIEVCLSARSPVQGSPTNCGVSKCDSEASIMSRLWPTTRCGAMEKQKGKKEIKEMLAAISPGING